MWRHHRTTVVSRLYSQERGVTIYTDTKYLYQTRRKVSSRYRRSVTPPTDSGTSEHNGVKWHHPSVYWSDVGGSQARSPPEDTSSPEDTCTRGTKIGVRSWCPSTREGRMGLRHQTLNSSDRVTSHRGVNASFNILTTVTKGRFLKQLGEWLSIDEFTWLAHEYFHFMTLISLFKLYKFWKSIVQSLWRELL